MMDIVLLIKFIYILRIQIKENVNISLKSAKKNGLGNLKNPKSFIEYSNNMQNVFRNIEEHNPGRKCNVLIIFNDMIDDMISNKKLNQIVTELFIRGRKINISTVFIT